jgi:ketosteroid isomerase-like protein
VAGTVNASGAAFSIDEVHVFTVADGVIVRFEAYIDTPAMLDALHA